jgi:hypothetical protein
VTTPAKLIASERVLTARIARTERLLGGQEDGQPAWATVRSRLIHLWEHGGEDGAADGAPRPDHIYVRKSFIYAAADHPRGPVAPRLIQSRGLQLRLALLMLFDAQCRHVAGEPVTNQRSVVRQPTDRYASWAQLTLADTWPTADTGRTAADLRARQIREALRALEQEHLVAFGRNNGGGRDFESVRLLSEASTDEERPAYTVPVPGAAVPIDRHFFTELWLFGLSDAEIATFLMLSFVRNRFRAAHADKGVFLTAAVREQLFRITRPAWRSTDYLHRFGVIDKVATPGRNFRTGNLVGDPDQRLQARNLAPIRIQIKDSAFRRPALRTIHQVLSAPTDADLLRRQIGQVGIDAARLVVE